MLSLDCQQCPQKKLCEKRFVTVDKGQFVYCPDGSRHLVDVNIEWIRR